MPDLWRIINDEQNKSPRAYALRALARVAALGYGLGTACEQFSYDMGWRRVSKAPLPVISVGNLTVGGTGKTPLVIKVVETLQQMGLRAAVVSRGHGRHSKEAALWVSRGRGPLIDVRQAGDEPYLLARRLPVPILVGRERAKLIDMLYREMGPHVVVGDDMFQHRRLYRDLDIVALDARQPLANGFVLPRGPLRELKSALRRAQAIVLTRAGDDDTSTRAWLRSFWGSGPVLSCCHHISGLQDLEGKDVSPSRGRRVLAFCGLANPAAFRQSLQASGLQVAGMQAFEDHHWFTVSDLAEIEAAAVKLKADVLVTSEKDAVRLPENWQPSLPVWSTRLDLRFKENLLPALLTWGIS